MTSPQLNTVFDGDDLTLLYREPTKPNESFENFYFLTFSAWSANGIGTPFAAGFLDSRGIRSFHVVQKRNHWWHTREIYRVRDFVLSLVRAKSARLVLYGSSMGGYGSFHLGETFDAWRSISIAPQITVKSEHILADKRWQKEWSAIEYEFSEESALTWAPPAGCFVFMDYNHREDFLHAQYFLSNNVSDRNVIVNVPHTLHHCARVLVKSSEFISLLISRDKIDVEALDILRKKFLDVFRGNQKTLLNFLRINSSLDDSYPVDSVLAAIEGSIDDLDFECMYFAAEFFLRRKHPLIAEKFSKLSLERYPLAERPDYLIRKHNDLIRKAQEMIKNQ